MHAAASVTRHIITVVPDDWRHAATTGTSLGAAPGAFRFRGDCFTRLTFVSRFHQTSRYVRALVRYLSLNSNSWVSSRLVLIR